MAKKRARKVPRGKSIVADMTDEQLDELAQITTADIMHAANDWKKHAPRQYKNVLAATADDTPLEDA